MSEKILIRRIAFLEKQIDLVESNLEDLIIALRRAGHASQGDIMNTIDLREAELQRLDSELLAKQKALEALQASKVPEKAAEKVPEKVSEKVPEKAVEKGISDVDNKAILQLIIRDRLQKALDLLGDKYPSDTVTLIKRKFSENENSQRTGTLPDNEYRLEKAIIASNILKLLKDIE